MTDPSDPIGENLTLAQTSPTSWDVTITDTQLVTGTITRRGDTFTAYNAQHLNIGRFASTAEAVLAIARP